MKAYNQQWIFNREVAGQAEQWYRQRLLTDEQITAIRQRYPVEFRLTNGFLEIGLFLFTTVAILACYLLPASVLAAMLESRVTYGIFNVAFGLGVGLVGRLLIRRQLLYRNGIDNAFVVTLAGFLAFGFNQFLPTGLSVATHCLLTLPLLLAVLWYYGDPLIAFLALATFYAFVFDGLLNVTGGKDALPFVMMVVSSLLYVSCRVLYARLTKNDPYYADSIKLGQWVALTVLVASGNYFVVRELNALLLNPTPATAPEITLPWLFWGLTFAIPGAYLTNGFRKKDRMLIILGGLGMVAAVATLHEYTALVPLNVALTLGGLLLIAIAVAGIRYLRSGAPGYPRNGFTDVSDEESPNELFANAQTLAAMQASAGAQHEPPAGVRFGGGEFGGGGSEGKY